MGQSRAFLKQGILAILFLLVIRGQASFGADVLPVVEWSEKSTNIPLGLLVEYQEDASGKKNIDVVRSSSSWKRFKDEAPNQGFTRSVYWLRFSILNKAQSSQFFYINTGYHSFDYVDFYVYKKGELLSHTRLGDLVPFKERAVQNKFMVLPLSLESMDNIDVYISFQTSGPLFFPITLSSPNTMIENETKVDYFFGYWYGILFAILCYNLFLYFSTGNVTYLIYVGYVGSLFLFQAAQHGYAFQFFWPESPWWANIAVAIFLSASNLFVVMFAISFLKLKQYRKIYLVMNFFQILSLASFFLCFVLPYSMMVKVSSAISLVAAPVVLLCGFYAWRKGYKPARFYLLAFSAFLTSMIIAALKAFGILPTNIFTTYTVQFGSSIETILLSLALGDKIKTEDLEKAEKINVLNHTLEGKNKELLHLNEGLENKVSEKTKEIGTLLHNINSGILSIELPNVVSPQYSAFLPSILGTNEIAFRTIDDLLLNRIKNGVDQIDQCRQAITMILGEDELAFSLNEDNLLKEVYYGEKILSIEWSVRAKDNGIVDKILMVINDVTEQKQQQALVQKKDMQFAKLKQLINIKEEKANMFFAVNSAIMNACGDILAKGSLERADIEQLFINYHTIKGAARTLGLSFLTNVVHEKEQHVKTIMDRKDLERSQSLLVLRLDFEEINDVYKEYMNIHVVDLNRAIEANKIVLSRQFLESHFQILEHALSKIEEFMPVKAEGIVLELVKEKEKLLHLIRTSLVDALDSYKEHFISVAKEVGKKAPAFHFNVQNVYLKDDTKALLDKIFVHIVRNTMDHGIESPEEREERGKPSYGTVSIDGTLSGQFLRLVVSDDGRGLSMDKLREKGLKNGIISDHASMEEVADLIFATGMTTAEKVSDISGRGVGMGAIREFLRGAGGDVKIALGESRSAGFMGFSLEITIKV